VNRLRKIIRLGALPLAAVAVLAIVAAIWLRGQTGVTIHGDVSPSSADTLVLGTTSATYAGCAQAIPRPGAQVTVTDPNGKIIGTGTLGAWTHARATTAGVTTYTCAMPFTITRVPHEPSYGFQIANVPGTIWVTSVNKRVSLNLSKS
jgi:hypothetical protein